MSTQKNGQDMTSEERFEYDRRRLIEDGAKPQVAEFASHFIQGLSLGVDFSLLLDKGPAGDLELGKETSLGDIVSHAREHERKVEELAEVWRDYNRDHIYPALRSCERPLEVLLLTSERVMGETARAAGSGHQVTIIQTVLVRQVHWLGRAFAEDSLEEWDGVCPLCVHVHGENNPFDGPFEPAVTMPDPDDDINTQA